MIEDPTIRLGKLAAERIAEAAKAEAVAAAEPAPACVGVFHGTMEQALELAAKAGLPTPAPVAEALARLDEDQCAAMVARSRERTDGSESPAASAEPAA